MISTKKLLYKICERINKKPQVRTVNVAYSISANGTWNTNLKTLIDADMPSGYRFGGISGWTTNHQAVFVVSARYVDGAYSLQLGSTATVTNSVTIQYLAISN